MEVSDSASHRRDQIANFAEILRNARAKQKVFEAVYFGKKQTKTIGEISKATEFSPKRVATIARPLAHGEKLFEQRRERIHGKPTTVYRKIGFVATNKRKILLLARSSQKLSKYHTKTNPRISVGSHQRLIIRTPFRVSTSFARIEDVSEFARAKGAAKTGPLVPARLPEEIVKKGIIKLLGEPHVPKDWGGENNDIFTTRLTLSGKKRRAAFALKGPAKTGPLVPKMMGKNGDQIQRLFNAPADVFFVQYEGEVKESIYKLMEELAKAKAVSGGRIFWGVIDGDATRRLRQAYPMKFRK